MIGFTILAQGWTGVLLAGFSSDRDTMAIAVQFLQLVSLNLVAHGLTFACHSMFVGLGNTKPVLLSSGTRLLTYAVPVIWLSTRPGFAIEKFGICRSRQPRCRPASPSGCCAASSGNGWGRWRRSVRSQWQLSS